MCCVVANCEKYLTSKFHSETKTRSNVSLTWTCPGFFFFSPEELTFFSLLLERIFPCLPWHVVWMQGRWKTMKDDEGDERDVLVDGGNDRCWNDVCKTASGSCCIDPFTYRTDLHDFYYLICCKSEHAFLALKISLIVNLLLDLVNVLLSLFNFSRLIRNLDIIFRQVFFFSSSSYRSPESICRQISDFVFLCLFCDFFTMQHLTLWQNCLSNRHFYTSFIRVFELSWKL